MRYTLVTTKEVLDGGGQRASGILYLETVAEPLDWPGQGFKEYRYDVTIAASSVPKYFSHRSRTMSIRGRGAERGVLSVTQERLYCSRYYARVMKLGNYPK